MKIYFQKKLIQVGNEITFRNVVLVIFNLRIEEIKELRPFKMVVLRKKSDSSSKRSAICNL